MALPRWVACESVCARVVSRLVRRRRVALDLRVVELGILIVVQGGSSLSGVGRERRAGGHLISYYGGAAAVEAEVARVFAGRSVHRVRERGDASV